MKTEKPLPSSEKDSRKNVTVFELDLESGASILSTPAGEQWRISAIDADKISFEKID